MNKVKKSPVGTKARVIAQYFGHRFPLNSIIYKVRKFAEDDGDLWSSSIKDIATRNIAGGRCWYRRDSEVEIVEIELENYEIY